MRILSELQREFHIGCRKRKKKHSKQLVKTPVSVGFAGCLLRKARKKGRNSKNSLWIWRFYFCFSLARSLARSLNIYEENIEQQEFHASEIRYSRSRSNSDEEKESTLSVEQCVQDEQQSQPNNDRDMTDCPEREHVDNFSTQTPSYYISYAMGCTHIFVTISACMQLSLCVC